MNKLSRAQIARIVADDIPNGCYVNLGIGMPTLIVNYISDDRDIIVHSENGIIGMRPLPVGATPDPDIINATKDPAWLAPGASISDHVISFAMMRGGHIDLTVLGAFQVSQHGDLSNWDTGAADSIPAVGGAMDLVVGAKRVFIMMEHVDRSGAPKIVETCSYPLTGQKVVDRMYTDLAIIDVLATGLSVRAMIADMSLSKLQDLTAAPLTLSPGCVVIEPSVDLSSKHG